MCFNIDYYQKNHHVWSCADQLYASLDQNDQNNFQHIFWVNDENIYPITVAKLKSIGVEVRNINTLIGKVQNLDTINDYIDKGFYGSMVDTLKYEVVKNYGRVALDLNFYLFTNNLYSLLNSYSFIGMTTSFGGLENAFIAAYKDHPILNAMSNVTNKMLEGLKDKSLMCSSFPSPVICQDRNLTTSITW